MGTLDVNQVKQYLQPILDQVHDQDEREAVVTTGEVQARLEKWRNWARQFRRSGPIRNGDDRGSRAKLPTQTAHGTAPRTGWFRRDP